MSEETRAPTASERLVSLAHRHWFVAAAWMGVIFAMSTDLGSEGHTSAIIEPILRWLDPGISPASISLVQFLVRKGAHVCAYLVLALLTLRAMKTAMGIAAAQWSWRAAAIALLVTTAYAATDEFHQSFIPSRGASVHDVLLDACGAATGLVLAYFWTTRRRS